MDISSAHDWLLQTKVLSRAVVLCGDHMNINMESVDVATTTWTSTVLMFMFLCVDDWQCSWLTTANGWTWRVFMTHSCKRKCCIGLLYRVVTYLHIYGVATVSRIDKIMGFFCKRALQKRRYSAEETARYRADVSCGYIFTYIAVFTTDCCKRKCMERAWTIRESHV